MTRVAILFLGRSSALGEAGRVSSWRSLLEASGSEVTDLPLIGERRMRFPRPADIGRLIRAQIVPESQAWSLTAARHALSRINPDVVIFITARAFHPDLVTSGRTHILDFNDALSRNYSYRGDLTADPVSRTGFRVLARAHRRFELSGEYAVQHQTAAGWGDAQYLGVEWITTLAQPRPQVDTANAHADVIFFGSLSYLPNIVAIERLGRIWPALLEARPGATAIIAGSTPHRRVVDVSLRHGWEVVADYSRLEDVAGRARLAVFPISYATGIQTKVLEAASMGLAQVASPAAVAGMKPNFPVLTASNDAEFVEVIGRLLDDPGERRRMAEEARRHVLALYSIEEWLPRVSALVGRDDADGSTPGSCG